jgi:fructose-specific phosphotransferase system IIA component
MSWQEILDTALITLDLPDGDKFQIIEELLDLAVQSGNIKDRDRALKDLIEREQYLSTGFENGLAVPHAKSEAVSGIVLAYGLNRKGMDFDSLDGKPTHFVFLLLSPMDTSGPHIQTLALLARNFQSAENIQKIKNVESKEELLKIFRDFK